MKNGEKTRGSILGGKGEGVVQSNCSNHGNIHMYGKIVVSSV